jgi:hypothetical protein
MNNPIVIKGNKIHRSSKNVKYNRKCNNCKQVYTGWGKYFCSKKCRMQPRGEESSSWKGDDIKVVSGRSRAERLFPLYKPCIVCGATKVDRHHLDYNTKNNKRNNIAFLCRTHHKAIHGPYPSQNRSLSSLIAEKKLQASSQVLL